MTMMIGRLQLRFSSGSRYRGGSGLHWRRGSSGRTHVSGVHLQPVYAQGPSPGPALESSSHGGSLQHESVPATTAASHDQAAPADQAGALGESVDVAGDAASAQQQRDEYVEVEVTTEEEVTHQARTPRETLQAVQSYFTLTRVGQAVSAAAAGLLLLTLGIAVYRAYQNANTTRAKRLRLVERNKRLVDELSKYLPDQRKGLTPTVVKGLCFSTGFTPTEAFRKYLWYVLLVRKFDHEAVNDLLALKQAAGLTDDDTADALQERASRIYQKYGTLMLNTEGFTAEGMERKATCKALFQKLLYLSECDGLVAQGTEAAKKIDLRTIFGATEEDLDKMRLVTLYDVDLEKAFTKTPISEKMFESEDEE